MSMVSSLPPTYSESQLHNKVPVTASSSSVESLGTITIQEINDAQYEDEKKAIYGHPLFPLMALLFEKCEQASQTSDCPSSESFDVDIQNFVQHQEKDHKPFFSEDPELDNLMVKAIQVLRIHLLELEKVNELCKDFCHRYIACLKGKLQSEQLLRVDTEFDDFNDSGSPPSSGSHVSGNQGLLNPGGIQNGGMVLQQPAGSVTTLNQVYQMVQTPQGLVAQPIQIQTAPVQTQIASSQVIQGSTPIGLVNSQTSQSSMSVGSTSTGSTGGNLTDSDDDDPLGKKKSKRGVLPKQATQVMKSWLFQHIVHPYPTEDEKRQIASQTNLTLLQVNNWFINARRRILQPMLDASNPEPAKKPKSKPQNRPLQRFWPESIANIQPQLPPGLQGSNVKTEGSTTGTNSQPLVIPIVTVNANAEHLQQQLTVNQSSEEAQEGETGQIDSENNQAMQDEGDPH